MQKIADDDDDDDLFTAEIFFSLIPFAFAHTVINFFSFILPLLKIKMKKKEGGIVEEYTVKVSTRIIAALLLETVGRYFCSKR